jgi:hypothetical protein
MNSEIRWLPCDRDFEFVQFSPAVGRNYQDSKFGLKLMILGESHYRWDGMPTDSSQTTLASISQGFTCRAFWTQLAKLFDQSDYVWEHALFYNYVQHLLDEPRQRPSAGMWKSFATVEGFKEVLRRYEPDRILVVGKDTWRKMPGDREIPQGKPVEETRFKLPDQFISLSEPSERCAYWYPTGNGKFALAAPIFHPRYPKGFHDPETIKAVKLLLESWEPPSRADLGQTA